MAAPWARAIELTLSRTSFNRAGVGQSRLLAISFSSSRSSASVSLLEASWAFRASVANSAPGVAMEHLETLSQVTKEQGWMSNYKSMLDHEARSSARKIVQSW